MKNILLACLISIAPSLAEAGVSQDCLQQLRSAADAYASIDVNANCRVCMNKNGAARDSDQLNPLGYCKYCLGVKGQLDRIKESSHLACEQCKSQPGVGAACQDNGAQSFINAVRGLQ